MARRVLALVVGVATALGVMVGAGERPVPPVRGGRRLLRRLPTARSTSPGAPFSGVAPDGRARHERRPHPHVQRTSADVLHVGRAGLARRAADHGQRPGHERGPLPDQLGGGAAPQVRLRRHERRASSGRRGAQPRVLHRPPVRRARPGVVPHCDDAGPGQDWLATSPGGRPRSRPTCSVARSPTCAPCSAPRAGRSSRTWRASRMPRRRPSGTSGVRSRRARRPTATGRRAGPRRGSRPRGGRSTSGRCSRSDGSVWTGKRTMPGVSRSRGAATARPGRRCGRRTARSWPGRAGSTRPCSPRRRLAMCAARPRAWHALRLLDLGGRRPRAMKDVALR